MNKFYWVFLIKGSKRHSMSKNMSSSPAAVRFCIRNKDHWKEGTLYYNSTKIGHFDENTGIKMTKNNYVRVISSGSV